MFSAQACKRCTGYLGGNTDRLPLLQVHADFHEQMRIFLKLLFKIVHHVTVFTPHNRMLLFQGLENGSAQSGIVCNDPVHILLGKGFHNGSIIHRPHVQSDAFLLDLIHRLTV